MIDSAYHGVHRVELGGRLESQALARHAVRMPRTLEKTRPAFHHREGDGHSAA